MGASLVRRDIGKEWARLLAEAVMLQALEDMWCDDGEEVAMAFFRGDGFSDCCDIIGVSSDGRRVIMDMAEKVLRIYQRPRGLRLDFKTTVHSGHSSVS